MEPSVFEITWPQCDEFSDQVPFFEAAGVATWYWEVDSDNAQFNRHWAEMLGYQLKELEPHCFDTWAMLVHQDDLITAHRQIQSLLAGSRDQLAIECRMRHKEGYWVKILSKGSVVRRNTQGQPLCVAGINMDITEQWRRELAIDALHKQAMTLANNLPGFVFQFELQSNGKMQFPFVSEQAFHIYGCQSDFLQSHPEKAHQVIHKEDWQRIFDAFLRSKNRLSPWQATFRICHPTKGIIWVEGHSIPIEEPGGRVVWNGYLTDITERINQGHRLELLSCVFKATGQGVVITDQAMNVVDTNPAFERLSGYRSSEVKGKSLNQLFSEETTRATISSMWSELEINGHWHGKVWHQSKDGAVFPQLLSIDMHDGGHLGKNYIAVFSDIRELFEDYHQLSALAHQDSLTQVSNRRAFEYYLDELILRCKEKQKVFALLYLDLDNFKQVNDRFGHQQGDRVLQKLANTLNAALRKGDMIARLGGDEFAILIHDCGDEASILTMIKRFEQQITAALDNFELSVNLGASIGAAFFPQDGIRQDTLLEVADKRMYHLKFQKKLAPHNK
ncbi:MULTISPECIES: sensor domain-containing diguanylate cyclase [unclassified Vibrio]|uniref:Diguanylate cyclase n=1 Tax=Vibrio sp. HB236076 TaxID=3232307 RepID=A0AB39HB07_9VIBR|nr:sensor domain-containing diguanylate cyclase [Vibrio sp. HB161653]MDP5254315.1 diguanylate cyclase [Vibrio sp. HB161653]